MKYYNMSLGSLQEKKIKGDSNYEKENQEAI